MKSVIIHNPLYEKVFELDEVSRVINFYKVGILIQHEINSCFMKTMFAKPL